MKMLVRFVALVSCFAVTGAEQLAYAGPADSNAPSRQFRASSQASAFRGQRYTDWVAAKEALRAKIRLPQDMFFDSTIEDFGITDSKANLSFDFTAGSFSAETTVVIKSSSQLFSYLYLYPQATLSGTISVADSEGTLGTIDVGQGILGITLRNALAPGEVVSLTITQSGVPNCGAGGMQVVTCAINSGLTFSVSQAFVPLLFGTSNKLPVVERSELAVTVPSQLKAVTNGDFIELITGDDGMQTYRFEQVPGDYFSMSVAPYTTGTTEIATGQTTTSYQISSLNNAASWREIVKNVMAFHGERFGSYGETKIDFAEIPDMAGAAYGPFRTIFMPTSLLAKNPQDLDSHSTLSHELAHQWFGGYIRPDRYAYSPWINEGMASFAALVYEESLYASPDFGPNARRHMAQTIWYMVPSHEDVALTSTGMYEVSSSSLHCHG